MRAKVNGGLSGRKRSNRSPQALITRRTLETRRTVGWAKRSAAHQVFSWQSLMTCWTPQNMKSPCPNSWAFFSQRRPLQRAQGRHRSAEHAEAKLSDRIYTIENNLAECRDLFCLWCVVFLLILSKWFSLYYERLTCKFLEFLASG